jgi:hypothetical protein
MCAGERVAQPVEHVTFNHGVLGSSPSALTKKLVNNLGWSRKRTFCADQIWGHAWGYKLANAIIAYPYHARAGGDTMPITARPVLARTVTSHLLYCVRHLESPSIQFARERTVRSMRLALIAASILLLGSAGHSQIRLGPGGVEIGPREPDRPRELERRPLPRDEL